MATTFLQATNVILQELNEVELSASNFSAAVGIHAFCKTIINRAYFDIVNAEEQWPFLTEGPPEEPFRGSLYLDITAGTQWYLLKTGSSDIRTDFKSVDWDTFYLTDYGVDGASAPYENRSLPFIDEDTWQRWYKEEDVSSVTSGNSEYSVPKRVIRSSSNRYVGLSPIPDKSYRLYFSSWVVPTALSASDDQLVIPDRWINVLYARARYYMWQFKESPQQASFAMNEYMDGIAKMRRNLIDPTPDDMTDDRIRFI